MSQPDQVTNLTAALREDIHRAWALIHEELEILAREWPTILAPVRAHRLSVFQVRTLAAMRRLDAQAAADIDAALSTAYRTGAWTAALVGGAEATFSSISPTVAAAFARDTLNDVLAATRGVDESVKALIRELGRDQILRAVYTGTTATKAGADLRAVLDHFGIHAVTYADGRKVGLPQYTDMLLRTKTAEAYQAGILDLGEENGWQWWELMDGPDCGLTSHDDPVKANGMIVTLDVARAHPSSHPNCLRASSPRPDIESVAQAEAAEPMNPEAFAAIQERAAAEVIGGSVPRVVATPADVAAMRARTAPTVATRTQTHTERARAAIAQRHADVVGAAARTHQATVGSALSAHQQILERVAMLQRNGGAR